MALIKTGKAVTVKAFKKAEGISKINVCLSRKKKKYAIDADGNFLFMISDDIADYADPAIIIQGFEDDADPDADIKYFAYIPKDIDIIGEMK